MNKKITKALKKMGIPQNLLGWIYIGDAIQMVLEDEDMIRSITKKLYPAIAVKRNTTITRVERAIRHAIETSMDLLELEVIEEVFGNSISPHKGKPCNSHFIAAVVEMIEEEE